MIGHSKAQTTFAGTNCCKRERRWKLGALFATSQVQSRFLWEFVLFLLVSMAALVIRNQNLHESFSEGVRQLLGYPISATLLTIVLASYGFSTLTLVLIRGGGETRLVKRLFHFSFRTVFYLFYGFSGALAVHYLFVLGTGLILYVCEQLCGWLLGGGIESHDGELLEEP